jgi:filamentous hemagglutinin
MPQSSRRRWVRRCGPLLLAASSVAVQFGLCAYGATESWTADSGDWATAANWNSGAGPVPGAGDTALIDDDDNTSRTVTYNYTGHVTLDSVTVDNDGPMGINTLSMTSTGTSLSAHNEYFGDSGTSTLPGFGVMNQSLGTNTVTETLFLGMGADDEGTYSLSGTGTLTTTNQQQIGYNGRGIVEQSAGRNNANGGLALAVQTGSSATYNLSGGLLSASGDEYVGYFGDGTLDQSSGTNTTTFALWVGYDSAATGEYILSGGELNVQDNETLGQGGGGASFDQTGGSNYANEFLNIESGTYALSGGLLNVTDYVSIGDVKSGVFSLSGTGTMSIGSNLNIGWNGVSATFTQSGTSSNLVEGDVYVGYSLSSSAEYDLSGGSLAVGGTEFIGNGGAGTFNQSGGTNFADGFTMAMSSAAIYNLSGGTLSPSSETIGSGAAGTFNQTGGINSANLTLALSSTSTYSLTGGSATFSNSYIGYGALGVFSLGGTGVLNSDSEYIGYSGIGNFTQFGTSSHTVDELDLGYNSGSSGEYVLDDGIFTANGNVYVGGYSGGPGGSGALYNEGGQLTIDGTLTVWGATNSEVYISGGTTTVAKTVNDALISQAGGVAGLGAVSGTGSIFVGNTSGAAAQMTVSALAQDSVTVESTGSFKMLGGSTSNTLNELTVNGSGVFDITNGHLFIDYGSGSDPVATIAAYIKSGFNGGAWNGSGIISSAAQTPTNGLYYGVGWADAKDKVVAGLASGEIEIKYTLLGDANLDGTVNGSDFSILAANFGRGFTNWDQGNFLFTPLINGADFAALAANFGQGDSGADANVTAADMAALDAFAASNGLPLPAVPEPAMIGVVGVGTAGLIRRRRHTRFT